ncbi:MAG: hypothetical protein QOF10_1833, partial [Kribbellaceae bacterium]|nr:hypothetical protein [Kribbellaceae bacterium]
SFAHHDIGLHGLWTPHDGSPVLYALVSYAEGKNPEKVAEQFVTGERSARKATRTRARAPDPTTRRGPVRVELRRTDGSFSDDHYEPNSATAGGGWGCGGSGIAWLDQAGFVGEDDCLDAVPEGEFGQDVGDVGLDRRLADHKSLRDLRV